MAVLQALARDLGADERTLRRAVRGGIVRARRLTPLTLSLPDVEIEYLRGHWSLLTALRAALRTERNVRLAVLFGSVARGTERAHSDLDVLVVLRDPGRARLAALESKLTRAAGREVSVVLMAHALRDAPGLVLAALDEGRVLADRDGVWREVHQRQGRLERRARERRARDRREAAEAVAALGALE